MKKAGGYILFAVTAVVAAFTVGLFLGGGGSAAPVTVMMLPAQTEAPTVPTTLPAPETTAPTAGTTVPETQPAAQLSTQPPASQPPATENAGSSSGRININTATVAELKTLPGIGDVLAQRIVDYRTAHGAFTRIEELMLISGIGEKRFAAIRELVTVGG